MSEIYVNATAKAKNKAIAPELRKALEAMIAPTRAEEGCILYDLYATQDANTFVLFESWKSLKALQSHLQTPHYEQLEKAAEGLMDRPLDIKIIEPIDRA